MGAMIDAAIRLEEFLDIPIVTPVDPFTPAPKVKYKEQGGKNRTNEGADKNDKDIFGDEVQDAQERRLFCHDDQEVSVRGPFEGRPHNDIDRAWQ